MLKENKNEEDRNFSRASCAGDCRHEVHLEGCAFKVALSAGLAVEAACLAMEGGGIHAQDGILDDSFDRLIEHLGELVCVGMGSTNDTIVHIMKDEKVRRPNC